MRIDNKPVTTDGKGALQPVQSNQTSEERRKQTSRIYKTIIMETLIRITIVCLLVTAILSCSKKKDPEPEKPQGYFLKTIQCTFPAISTDRNSSFNYDEKNRIKEYKFNFTTFNLLSTIHYNELDLVTRIDDKRTSNTSGGVTENSIDFRYAARALNEIEYTFGGNTTELITYNAVANSYDAIGLTFSLDANNNLRRLDSPSSNWLTMNYSSGSGIYGDNNQNQIAMYIYAYILFTSSFIDIYHWSGNEIISGTSFGTSRTYSNVRDDHGNIVQTDIKNTTGNLIYRYVYTYELRDLQ